MWLDTVNAWRVRQREKKLFLTTATGKLMEVGGECHIELKHGEEIFEPRVVVASISEKIIFVLDFMKANYYLTGRTIKSGKMLTLLWQCY